MKKFKLPKDYKPYIDKYFLRAKEILEKDELNPMVIAQVFIRKGNCKIHGIDEAIEILTTYSDIKRTGKIYALEEGSYFAPGEALMLIEAPIQNIVDLETMYLGVLSRETTLQNDKIELNLGNVECRMKKIVDLTKDRPVFYMGARHWGWEKDSDIAQACAKAGATATSTDIGASHYAKPFNKGMGTIPHALEAIYDWKHGKDRAVIEATKAFNRHMPLEIPRIALVDYANREIIDTLNIATLVEAVRVDTCGENNMQGTFEHITCNPAYESWHNKGVSIYGVYLLRKLLNDNHHEDVDIILSSGFANPDKVKKFLAAEKHFNIKLFNGLGVGNLFPSRMATMDIISVENEEIHKTGRTPLPTDKLKRVV